MKKLKMFLSLVAIVSCIGCSSASNPEAETAAVAAAKGWLSRIDAEKYAESWDEAAALFKGAVSKEQWVQTMQAERKPFGKNISRELKSKRYCTSLPGIPGECVVIQFKALFENKKSTISTIETVTPMMDKDGKWRMSGYYIKSVTLAYNTNAMPDIYIAAIITSVLSLLVIGGLLLFRTAKEERIFLGILILVMLPMNALAFHCVRMPIDAWLSTLLGESSKLYQFIRVLYAPFTEEPSKLWPLLIPWIYSRIGSRNFVSVAIAIGLGFGVGEAWTVAGLLSKSPEIAMYPWYMLGGYINERIMVCVMHSAFTGVALHFIIKRKAVIIGLLSAMLLHFIANFPIFLLAQKNLFSIGKDVWSVWMVILQIWVLSYFLLTGFILAYLAYGKQWIQKLFKSKMKCPECENIYQRPIFKLILFHKNYEKCPHCKHWHFVSAFDYENKSQQINAADG